MAKGNMLKLGLLENAIDSIVHGLEHYADGKKNTSNYKFAILHITQGVELILKERLRREHWVLIYEKVENPDTSKTINFETAVARLQSICKLSLDKYIGALRRLRGVRHEIEHYKVSFSEQEATALIGSNIPFLLEFLENELGVTLQEHIADEEVWQELLLIEEVYNRARKRADEEIAWLRWDEKEGDYHWIQPCPICNGEYLIMQNKDEAKCVLCQHISRLEECWKCGEPFPEDDWGAEGGLCANCTAYLKEPYT